MARDLLDGETEVGDGLFMTQRGWAAEQLRILANEAEHGSFPQGMTAFDIGRALGRAMSNSNESDWQFIEAELFRGMLHYRELKQK
jgi:hypothetical protein